MLAHLALVLPLMLIAFAIWLIVVLLVLAFCGVAASADRRDLALHARYPSRPSLAPTDAPPARLVALGAPVREEAPEASGERLAPRGGRRAVGA